MQLVKRFNLHKFEGHIKFTIIRSKKNFKTLFHYKISKRKAKNKIISHTLQQNGRSQQPLS